MSFEEQIMSKDKYPSIFLCQTEAIVFIFLQIFFATCTVRKTGEYLTTILFTKVEVASDGYLPSREAAR